VSVSLLSLDGHEKNGENVARLMARLRRAYGEKYIHELADWTGFTWDSKTLPPLLSAVRLHRGLLLGKMRGYAFASQWAATLKVLTEETIKSSAIEGVVLDGGRDTEIQRTANKGTFIRLACRCRLLELQSPSRVLRLSS